MMNFILGFLCGILFSVGVVFFLKWLSTSIHKMDYI
jgi:capsular polysaccharide biosynthesis protein